MNFAWTFFAVFALVCLEQSKAHHVNVNVTVYYESLCPDSIKFINKQLFPSLKNLSEHVDLQLIPYGKSVFKIAAGEYQFTCHHGEDECVGNILHACALRKINDPAVAVSFIDCLMSNVDRSSKPVRFPVKDCAASRNVYNLAEVENCSNHPDGKRYLADFGLLTLQLKPALKSVPTIVFNNMYSEEDTNAAQSNFVGVLCKYIQKEHEGAHGVPNECLSYSKATLNAASMVSLSIWTLIASIFYLYY